MLEPVKQQGDENEASQDAHDQFDGQLVGGDYDPADHVAYQHKNGAEQSGIHQRAPDLVSLVHGHHIGHDQPDVGDGTNHHHNAGGDHGSDGEPGKEDQVIRDTQVLGKILAQPYDIEMVGEDKGQHHQRNCQPDDLIPAFQHQREVAHQPGGQSLGHLIFVSQIVGNAADDIAEHDAHQRDHHHILELDALNEPDEDPGAQNRRGKGKNGSAPQCGGRHKQQSQQDAELGRGDGGAGGWGHKFVAAQLLHDESCHAHTNAGA